MTSWYSLSFSSRTSSQTKFLVQVCVKRAGLFQDLPKMQTFFPSHREHFYESICSCVFQYICYPWKDDSGVAASEKRDLCRRSSDCRKPGQECQRHQDRRKINKGLCMNEVSILNTI